MMHGITESVGDGLSEGLKFVARRCVAGDTFFVDAVGTQQPPFVMIMTEPHIGDVFPAMVIGNFRRGKVVVIIDNGEIKSDFMK